MRLSTVGDAGARRISDHYLVVGRGASGQGNELHLVGAATRSAGLRRYGSNPKLQAEPDQKEACILFDEFTVRLDMTPLRYETAIEDGESPTQARAVLIHVEGGEVVDSDGSESLQAGTYVLTGKLFAFGGPPGWRGTIDIS